MSNRDKMARYREGVGLLDRRYQWRDGDIKINVDNDDDHEVAKFLVALELKRQGKAVITEAIFKNGRRADVFVPEDMEVYEIAKSESQRSLDAKKEQYAKDYGVGVLICRATEIVNVWIRKRISATSAAAISRGASSVTSEKNAVSGGRS